MEAGKTFSAEAFPKPFEAFPKPQTATRHGVGSTQQVIRKEAIADVGEPKPQSKGKRPRQPEPRPPGRPAARPRGRGGGTKRSSGGAPCEGHPEAVLSVDRRPGRHPHLRRPRANASGGGGGGGGGGVEVTSKGGPVGQGALGFKIKMSIRLSFLCQICRENYTPCNLSVRMQRKKTFVVFGRWGSIECVDGIHE